MIKTKISVLKVVKRDVKVDSKDDVLNTLTYLSDVNANAYAIYKDDVRVAVLDCKDAAEEILQAIKDTYIRMMNPQNMSLSVCRKGKNRRGQHKDRQHTKEGRNPRISVDRISRKKDTYNRIWRDLQSDC